MSQEEQTYQLVKSPAVLPDVLPRDHEYHTYVKKVVRHRCRQSGYRRITVPSFENVEIFKRAYGENSSSYKEIQKFEHRDGQMMGMRPSSMPSIARAYVQNNMHTWPAPVEFFFIDPHFKIGENPGRGRYDQFWQFGFEVLGENDPALEAQMIQMCKIIFRDLGIDEDLSLEINSLGDHSAMEAYNAALKDYFFGKERYLDEQAKIDLEENPMRLLDSDNEDISILAELAPSIEMFWDKETKNNFEELKEYLDELGIEYTVNHKLVRNADFYNGTVFEFKEMDKKGALTVGGGGHHDNLVEKMGGEPTPALGFAAGMGRIVAMMKRKKLKVPSKDHLHIFVAQLGKDAKKKCLGLIKELRDHGVKTMGAMGKGAIRHQLTVAEKFGVPYTLILGLTEVREGTIIIRDMSVGTQETVPFEDAVEKVLEKLEKSSLDKYSPGEVLY